MRKLARLSVIGVGAFFASLQPSLADGALAVGVPQDVAKDGFSWGYAVGRTQAAAQTDAMTSCRNGSSGPNNGPVAAKKLCRVVETFKDKCVAITEDPEVGTPGVGWAVGATTDDAIAKAMQMCTAKAGSRAQFCHVVKTACDGSAN